MYCVRKVANDLYWVGANDPVSYTHLAHAPLDVLQMVPLWLFTLFPDDVRQHGVPDLSGGGGGRVPAGDH